MVENTSEEKNLKLSYMAKESLTCPVCGCSFHKEELLSGSGRLIADELTDELHRTYKPSARYGNVYPLAYAATVCPKCSFASVDDDFMALPREQAELVRSEEKQRLKDMNLIFPDVNFSLNRRLLSGAAALYLAARCYAYYPPEISPTMKQGMSVLRCAWLMDDLHKKYPGRHYDWLAVLFKRKAQFLYSEALRRETAGTESLSGVKNFGPDTDKNYGFEGALYLSGVLLLKYGDRENDDARKAALRDVRHTIARIFGMGKTSKGKPGPLLENVKSLYSKLGAEIGDDD